MKSHRQELWFEVPARRAFLNITPEVEAALRQSGIQEGICLVNAMHISASVFINDDEKGLHADFEKWLEKLAPEKPHAQYAHNRGEDNADGNSPAEAGRYYYGSRTRPATALRGAGMAVPVCKAAGGLGSLPRREVEARAGAPHRPWRRPWR